MELASIDQIREQRDFIREKIKDIDYDVLAGSDFGGENEYSQKGLIGGIEALLTDISTLTKATRKFVKISTSAERKNIVAYLTRINTYFNSPQNYLPQFEALKILLRGYNVRNFSERQIEFEEEIVETRKIKLDLQEELAEVKVIKKKILDNNESIKSDIETANATLTELNDQLETISKLKDELISESDELKEINSSLEAIKLKANENLSVISTSLTESKSSEKLINSFASKIQIKDKRLIELEQEIDRSKDKLSEYEKERVGFLKEANELIESSKKALNYKTAEGISASFQSQYDKANDIKKTGSWILGALVCLLGTIGLGIWILYASPDNIGILIGRISLLPLPIIGAVFCANQYTKQKNIIEDYAYKMVLSKAIVGFSEQLKKNGSENNEEYVHYIKTALEEIHKDPLRKRSRLKERKTETPGLKDLVDVAEKIIKMSKPE